MMNFSDITGIVSSWVLILSIAFGAYFGLKKWVQKVSRETGEVRKQLQTSNGKTVGDFTEETAHKVNSLSDTMDSIVNKVDQNTTTAHEALILAKQANERIDALLVGLKLKYEATLKVPE